MTRKPSSSLSCAMLAAAGLLWASGPAEAAPIRGGRLMIEAAQGNPLEAYFRSALRRHSLNIHLDAATRRAGLDGLEHILSAEGQLPDTAFVQYLRWRRGLHTLRFDANHPRLAAMLQVVRAQQFTPTSAPPQVDGLLIGPPTHQAPEPSTWLVAAGLMAAGAAYRRQVR